MARKKRRGGRGLRIGKWVNLAFKILGASVAAYPAITAVSDHMSNPKDIPVYVLYNYTGVSSNGVINPAQTTAGIASVVGGLLIAKIGGFLGRRF